MLLEDFGATLLQCLRSARAQRHDARLHTLEKHATLCACLLECGSTLPLALGDGRELVALRLENAIHGTSRQRGIVDHGRQVRTSQA